MKHCTDVHAVINEIGVYEKTFSGMPMLIGIDSAGDYRTLLEQLRVDTNKQIVRMSGFCDCDFPPDPTYCEAAVSAKAKEKLSVWIGASQAIMFYGREEAEKFFRSFAGKSFSGPIVVLCPYCSSIFESLSQRYVKLGQTMICWKNSDTTIPSICLSSDDAAVLEAGWKKGFKDALAAFEDGDYGNMVCIATSCVACNLACSMFPIVKNASAYERLCAKEPSFALRVKEETGCDEQWKHLLQQVIESGSLAALCVKQLCDIENLSKDFADFLSGSDEQKFLCFVCLKAYCVEKHDYLSLCLTKSSNINELIQNLYNTILEVAPQDLDFSVFLRQRSRILHTSEENHVLMKQFCNHALCKGRDILLYLSDSTEEERVAMIHALCVHHYEQNELMNMLQSSAPNLALYLSKFTFNEVNTKIPNTDAEIRPLMTEYFQQYKFQKLTNHQDTNFLELVQTAADGRIYSKLQARAAILKKIKDKDQVQPYFFDALGVEYLGYIISKAEMYGMHCDCSIGHCNLPSITSKNKEFYEVFPEGSIKKIDELDNLKHEGVRYDYQVTSEPIHIFDELDVINKQLKKISTLLASGAIQRAVILSDHGASRLAVTYRSENEKLVLQESGQHSGRCCPADTDPQIPSVYYEDGFAVLANYERFKGSRKSDVETHGGASLEETVVPIIELTLKSSERILALVDDVVKCGIKGTTIELTAKPALTNPRVIIDDVVYYGQQVGDSITFELTKIKRNGHYAADIYDGDKKVGSVSFEAKRGSTFNSSMGI